MPRRASAGLRPDGDEMLGLVDFVMFPHLDHETLPDNSMADAERWAAGIRVAGYAIGDQTALNVIAAWQVRIQPKIRLGRR